ncbi:MAG: hypothetical protein SNJ84_06885, partial [Verrucomicrobiia bacterium]
RVIRLAPWFLPFLTLTALASPPIIEIGPSQDMMNHVGKSVIVTGLVERVVTLPQGHQRIFFRGDSNFYGFIFLNRRETLGNVDFSSYSGKTIFLAGRVADFEGRPQIVIHELHQIGESPNAVRPR